MYWQWRFQDLTLGGGGGGEGGGREIIESVNIWSKSPILACFGPISFKSMLKIYREWSERKNIEKK